MQKAPKRRPCKKILPDYFMCFRLTPYKITNTIPTNPTITELMMDMKLSVPYIMNGLMIPVRTKGPLFIIYPFDAKKQLQHKTYYERSIWQLKAIEVE